MKHTGSEIIIKILERQGITHIAGIPGGANLPLYDALERSEIQHILARHEQGAGFIAQGIARTTGKPAVCFATSGPGAANLMTAIADAKMDSIPMIAITGQVPKGFVGKDSFQEVDTYGMSLPVTKHNFFARSASDLLEIMPAAFEIAGKGRPGPVLIDLPKDVQKELVEFDSWPEIVETGLDASFGKDYKEEEVSRAIEMINNAKKPVLYIGGGIIHSDACEEILALAEKNSIPVSSTLMGLGAFPSDHPLFLNMLGMHGPAYTNYILRETDLLIAVGARFDDRATGAAEEFCPQANILHIDLDSSEINKIKETHCSVVGNAKDILQSILPRIASSDRKEWISEVNRLKAEFPMEQPGSGDLFHPVRIIQELGKIAPADAIITTDVGQHQMWAAQYYPFKAPRTFYTSGGSGTMGFGLPVAIGAALAEPKKKIICISGDGSFLMNIQELAVLADLGIDVTTLVLNNQHLGLVRQQQELFYNKKYIASKFETTADFAAVSNAFGVKGINLKGETDPMDKIKEALDFDGPVVLDIPIDYKENVFPMVPPGAANHDMIGVKNGK